MKSCLIFVLGIWLFTTSARAQDSGYLQSPLPDQFSSRVSDRISAIDKKLVRQTAKLLTKMKKEEAKLFRKMKAVDSTKASALFNNSKATYDQLQQKLVSATSSTGRRIGNYIPYLDTLKNLLRFLEQAGLKDAKLSDALKKVAGVEGRFDQAAAIQQFLRERRQYLKEQLGKFNMAKHLKKINKEVYYYSQLLKDAKQTLSNPSKIEEKAMGLLTKIPAVKNFIAKNSSFASVFGTSSSSPANFASISGVQTRANVQQAIRIVTAASPGGGTQVIQPQLQAAGRKVEELANKVSFIDVSGNPEPAPDFKPNAQKTKSFLQRLEYAANVQFGKVNNLLPVSGDLALSVGYKINDKSVIGIGTSYKMGLGTGWNNIRFSTQGYGLRSYIDWQIKGRWWLSGGYEQNYLSSLNDLPAARSLQQWQESGLLGLTSKYSLGKKKKGYVQLLFDFLSYRNIPQSQPLLIRTGISF